MSHKIRQAIWQPEELHSKLRVQIIQNISEKKKMKKNNNFALACLFHRDVHLESELCPPDKAFE